MKKLYTMLFALLVAGSAVAQQQNQTISISSTGTFSQLLQGLPVSSAAKIIIEAPTTSNPTGGYVTVNNNDQFLKDWGGTLVIKGTLFFGTNGQLNLGQNAQIIKFGTVIIDDPNGQSTKVKFGNGNLINTDVLNDFSAAPGGTILSNHFNGSPTSPLPVALMYFKGKATANSVKLEWATASEQNNDRFEIEASTDGETWSNAGTVYSLNPNSDTRQFYAFEHRASNASYYRLKQVDFTGETSSYTTYIRNGASAEQVNRVEYRTLDGKLVTGSTPGPKVKVNHYQSGNLSTEVMP